jgi:hypothetical protein
MKLVLCASLLFGFSSYLSAQAILEAGAITGATATAGGAAGKATGKGITNVFGSIEKTMKSVGAADTKGDTRAASAATPAAALPQKPAEPVKLPDVAQIALGMSREDLLAKFGSPSQKITLPDGSHLTERFRYDVDKETVRVVLEDGKVKEVAAVHPEPLPKTN